MKNIQSQIGRIKLNIGLQKAKYMLTFDIIFIKFTRFKEKFKQKSCEES